MEDYNVDDTGQRRNANTDKASLENSITGGERSSYDSTKELNSKVNTTGLLSLPKISSTKKREIQTKLPLEGQQIGYKADKV